jgi:hypothetical protein
MIAGVCWETGGTPKNNRWFKFTAPAIGVGIQVTVGGASDIDATQRWPQLAGWEADGTTPVGCDKATSDIDTTFISAPLIQGDEYYISVDTKSLGDAGTFKLELLAGPTAICQDITRALDLNGQITVLAEEVNDGSTGNPPLTFNFLGIPNSVPSRDYNCNDIGNKLVILLVKEDGNPIAAACVATITIEDNLPPTMDCNNISIELDNTGNATIVPADINDGSTDNCSIASLMLDKTTFSCSDPKVNSVVLTGQDPSRNSQTCNAIVTIDNIPESFFTSDPTISCGGSNVFITTTGSEAGVAYQLHLDSDDSPVFGPVPGTGSPISFQVSPLATTVYYVMATSSSISCSVKWPSLATVTVLNLTPTIVPVGNDPATCGGMGSIDFTFTNVPNNQYDLDYLDGGGFAQQFTNVTVTGGTASVNAPEGSYNNLSITVASCTSIEDPSVTLNDPALPNPTLTSDVPGNEICAGETVTFTAGGGTTYEFFVDGVPAQGPGVSTTYVTDTLTNGQIVSVEATTVPGCAASASIVITVNPLPDVFFGGYK